MSELKVCVLIANHNYGRYLERAINSAFNQTVKPKCICVVDDGSEDNSWDVFNSIIKPIQTEEHVNKSNLGDVLIKVGVKNGIDLIGLKLPKAVGPSAARNAGILFTMPVTDIYAILDADDEFLPNKLEECLQPFKNQAIGLVYANYYLINEDTGVKLIEVKEPYSVNRLMQECIVHSGFLVRAACLNAVKDKLGYYDVEMRTCEDWDLEIRLSRVCLFYHIPKALTNVLVHQNNSTNSVKREIWEQNWNRIRVKHFSK